jgi:hypothetical protein
VRRGALRERQSRPEGEDEGEDSAHGLIPLEGVPPPPVLKS